QRPDRVTRLEGLTGLPETLRSTRITARQDEYHDHAHNSATPPCSGTYVHNSPFCYRPLVPPHSSAKVCSPPMCVPWTRTWPTRLRGWLTRLIRVGQATEHEAVGFGHQFLDQFLVDRTAGRHRDPVPFVHVIPGGDVRIGLTQRGRIARIG